MASPDYILYERRDAVGIITLNRADARNAQNLPLLTQLDAAFMGAAEDPEVRVIVLLANGPHF